MPKGRKTPLNMNDNVHCLLGKKRQKGKQTNKISSSKKQQKTI